MPGHDPHGSAKRRRTLETLAMKNRSGRAPFGAVDGNTLAGRARQPSSRQGKKSERALSPADVRARDAFDLAPASPMDAEMDAWEREEEDDAPFGVSESFHEWLTRVGLRGPLDPDRGGTLVSARQREELQRVWGDAAETETLRRLVENLKDGELEMARMTQAAHERATRELEAETETAWRGRLEAASDAERSAKEELHAREAAVDAAEAEVREERRAARDAAEASDALRSRLEAATRASNVASQRASCLEDELREAKAEVTHAGRALARAKQERDALEQNLRMELASQREGFEQERDAYHKTRDDAAARERLRHNELVERLRSENRDLRAAAASAAERLRLTTRDGADGKAALKQALALREAEAEVGRRTAGEAQRRLRVAEEHVARLEARVVELRAAAETKIAALERALASAKASASAAETAEAVAEEGAAKMKRAAAEAVANAEAKAREAQRAAEAAVRRAKDEAEAATASARAARDAAHRAALESVPANDALRAALERVTNAHASAVARAEAAERRGDALREELAATKRAAAAAAKQVASAVADARGGGPRARVEAKEHELKRVEAQVAEAEKRLRSLRRDAEEAAAPPKPVAQKTPKNDADEADPLQTRYASITPRTRSRASLRASHGAARPQSPAEDTRSPGTELRRRAIAMGMRASPFAPKRKR
jgi:chromosome segregation ATPase